MSKEKQIEEMTNDLIFTARCGTYRETAEHLYNAGYRKHSENMVEVVRCKDCTHFQTINGRTLCSINATRGEKLWLGLRATVEDGFCHHGEKMKGGADQ